ncbi:Nucleoside transporter, putative [Angomonas deanei]|uniref:Nucleoside transporter, putative n=1 Tax=Angomonas deanei TaxID=59799 RepID=A0A7G2CTG3_9TRYP|nr:Nucleoside transporter, putative [Angomonas deanei]
MAIRSPAEILLFITAVFAGVSMLVGINAINSAPAFMLNYNQYAAQDENAVPVNTSFWKNILTIYTVVTLVTQTILQPTNLTRWLCCFSLQFRLQVASVFMTVEMLMIVLMPRTGVSEGGAIAGLVIAALLGAVGRAYFENTGFGMFGTCPPRFIGGVLIGVALSGAWVSVLQLILLGSMSDNYDDVLTQSAIYFSIAIAIILIAAVLVFSLLWNSEAQKYIAEFSSKRSAWRNIYRRVPDDKLATLQTYRDVEEEPVKEEVVEGGDGSPKKSVVETVTGEREAEETTEETGLLTTGELIQTVRLWPVIQRIWPMMLSCLLTYGITYIIYPGILIAVDHDDAWYQTIVMAVYNGGILLGCIIAMFKKLWIPRKGVLIAAICRIIFIPLLLLCATGVIKPNTKAAAYVITVIFSLTHGYLATLSMVYAPKTPTLVNDGERALAGQATDVCLLLGCSVFSLLQLAIVLPL